MMKIKYIKNNKNQKGQTVIETALMMIFLLVLFFGIAEIARAWWLKNQLNNAARVGVRVAVVTQGLSNISPLVTCVSANPVVIATCNSITNAQLRNDTNTRIGLTIADNGNGIIPDAGDTVTVSIQGNFNSVVPNLATLSFGLFRGTYVMQTNASMRYE